MSKNSFQSARPNEGLEAKGCSTAALIVEILPGKENAEGGGAAGRGGVSEGAGLSIQTSLGFGCCSWPCKENTGRPRQRFLPSRKGSADTMDIITAATTLPASTRWGQEPRGPEVAARDGQRRLPLLPALCARLEAGPHPQRPGLHSIHGRDEGALGGLPARVRRRSWCADFRHHRPTPLLNQVPAATTPSGARIS